MAATSLHQVTAESVYLKFRDTPAYASIVNGAFTVRDVTSATPVTVAEPFKTIALNTDYDSLSRGLYLWWRDDLTFSSDHTYEITISGLKDIFGNTLTASKFNFTGVGTADPGGEDDGYERPVDKPTEIEDHSLLRPNFPITREEIEDTEATAATAAFLKVMNVTPDITEAYMLEPTDYEGKITITFNFAPAANFVNPDDFRLQKKSVHGMSRWTDVETSVVAESGEPKVSVFLPSTDTEPIYSYQVEDDEAHTFWQPDYKYRLVLSKNIGY